MAKDETKIGTVRYQYALMAMLVTTGKNILIYTQKAGCGHLFRVHRIGKGTQSLNEKFKEIMFADKI